ncbi:electron transfer flavoprotein subunit alpha/FixB family protein, partial [Ancylobacter sp. VNQ12]
MSDNLPTLLFAEHDDTHLNPVTARALTAALALGAPVHVLVVGENARPA